MADLTWEEVSRKLQDPFPYEDVEWRTRQCGIATNGKPYAIVMPYIDNRAVQARLDEVLGLDGWENTYKADPLTQGYLCGITIHLGGKSITKWDGSQPTKVEPLKGALSDSMKRAAVQFGVGRYLYSLGEQFAQCRLVGSRFEASGNVATYKDKNNNKFIIDWTTPSLPDWALPEAEYQDYLKKIESAETMVDLKTAFANGYVFARSFGLVEAREIIQKAYQKRKSYIDDRAKENVANEYAQAKKWIEDQKRSLELIPYTESVQSVGDNMIAKLEKMADGQYYDKESLIKLMREAINNRIKELKGDKK